jgi:hypothetical protein
MHNEAVSLLGAATETTSWALGVMTYYLLSQPQTMRRLRAELEAAVEDRNDLPPLTTLEKLPYLSAVIPTNEDLVYRGEFKKKPVELVLPRGFAVGMSSAITHHDERYFPRILLISAGALAGGRREVKQRPRLGVPILFKGQQDVPWNEKSQIVPWKPQRNKLRAHISARSLAMCELHLTLAALTLRVLPRMRLYQTTVRDIRYDYDTLSPNPVRESRGIRVTIE